MFTGLIETTGTVLSVTRSSGTTRLVVAAPALAGRWGAGDSIAVNGVCLTALEVMDAEEHHPGRFAADLAAETVERTTLSNLTPGALANLELPTPSGAPLGGHVVQGHVDGTARLKSLISLVPDNDNADWRMTLQIPERLARYIVPQGSITVEGISLTIAKLDGLEVEIAIIPHTYRSTNLHSLLAGADVNIEVDVLGKYAERQALEATPPPHAQALTTAYLLRNGY